VLRERPSIGRGVRSLFHQIRDAAGTDAWVGRDREPLEGRYEMTKTERAEMYRKFLVEEGYSPEIDRDGDVVFKLEGKSYALLIDEKDDMFFNLIFPGFWSIDSEEERAKVIQAACAATGQTKVVKVYPVKNNTWAAIEMFCFPPEGFKPIFKRAVSALQAGVANFVTKMKS
jgi:hypothetical protein